MSGRLDPTRPATLFLLLAIPLGFAWAVVTPPMRVPDEASHFLRAEQIAHGGVLGSAALPAGVIALARDAEHAARRMRSGRDPGWSRERLAALAAAPPAGAVREPFDGGRALGYPPVPYLPAIAALAVLRPLDVRPLAQLYAARLAQLAGAIALLHAALRATPVLAWPLCLLALAPTASFLRSGVSADPATMALAFLVFALAVRPLGRVEPGARDARALCAASLGLALAKTAYLPLTLVVLVWPRSAFASARERDATLLACIVVPWLAGIAWLAAATGGDATGAAIAGTFRAEPAQQMALLRADPLRFVQAVAATWSDPNALAALAHGAIGRLGLLDVELPVYLTVLWAGGAVLLALLAGDGGVRIALLARLVLAAAALGCVAAISLVAWLEWSPLGSGTVFGLQGRYLLPLAPYLLMALPSPARARGRISDRHAAFAVAVLAIAGNVAGLVALARHDWAG